MSNSFNCPNQQIPVNYSGVTIHITNPTVNAGTNCISRSNPADCGRDIYVRPPYVEEGIIPAYPYRQDVNIDARRIDPYGNTLCPENTRQPFYTDYSTTDGVQSSVLNNAAKEHVNTYPVYIQPQNQDESGRQILEGGLNTESGSVQQTYPPQYYLNNYNYIHGNDRANDANTVSNMVQPHTTGVAGFENKNNGGREEDLSVSKGIINELETREAGEKELEENGKQTRVVALTDEYIMSLENYLNNPNSEIRLMASKEILTRLDEDKSRYDDAALNALLNKMLQDPNKLVRAAALSAFSSQLASGNNYTVTLLNNIQQNPESDKEDVLESAEILLKMSSATELRYTPAKNTRTQEQKVEK